MTASRPPTPEGARTVPAAPVTIEMAGVRRRFGDRTVLDGIDITVSAGEVVALLGPSGCGKSTLLRLVAGLDTPTAGRVEVAGQPVRGIERRCAMVFQDPRLLPWRTLAGNVAFGLPQGSGQGAARGEVGRWLEVVGLTEFAAHRPRQVSGGMAQRTALARALARRPGALLLDEPFAALDALTRLRMQDLVDEVQRLAGTTVLMVTHDVEEALWLADRLVVLAIRGASGARVLETIEVPGIRPRDRGDPALAALRAELLDRLGVPRHAPERPAVHTRPTVDKGPTVDNRPAAAAYVPEPVTEGTARQ